MILRRHLLNSLYNIHVRLAQKSEQIQDILSKRAHLLCKEEKWAVHALNNKAER